MKKVQVIAAAALLAIGSTVAVAQDPQPQGQRQGGGPGGQNMTAMMMQGITLSAEQQAKVDSITKKGMADMQALRADQSMEQDARRAKMREMRQKQNEDIKAILTDEQKKVYEKNMADMQARMQERGGQRPPQR